MFANICHEFNSLIPSGVVTGIFSWVNHPAINFDFFCNEMVQVSSKILVQNVGETGVEIATLLAGFCPTHE